MGEDLLPICDAIINDFADGRGVGAELFEPETLNELSEHSIDELLQPLGWRNLCYSIDDSGKIKKKSYWNRDSLREVCRAAAIPYWRDMYGHEMRAVLIRWAIEEKVAELR